MHVTKFDQKSCVITSTVKEKSVFLDISIKDVKYFYSITCKATELDVLREHESVKGNGRKKVLVIGKTGTGKSSLCNVISGHSHDADVFDVSSAPTSKQETQIADVFFDNQRSKLIRKFSFYLENLPYYPRAKKIFCILFYIFNPRLLRKTKK